jgi:hypothetical protein
MPTRAHMPTRPSPAIPATFRRTIPLAAATLLLVAACSGAASPAPASPSPAMSPGMSEPAMSEPAMSEPAMSEPAMSPGMSEPAMSEPAMSPGMSEPAMSPTPESIVEQGPFVAVDGTASGTAALHHLADGSFAVSLDNFSIASADHVSVLLVKASDVMHTSDVDPSTALDLGPLTGTHGMQDYAVPADMAASAMSYQSVVLWDTQAGHAIAAAMLAPLT